MFHIFLTGEAQNQYRYLEKNKGLNKRFRAVRKTLQTIERNPRHPGLQTHKFTTLNGPNGEEIFESYAEQNTPAAYRIFWYYGPKKNEITIISITSHP